MRILFLVPDLATKGGIQDFARTQFAFLRSQHDVTLENWTNPMWIQERFLLPHLPEGVRSGLFRAQFHGGCRKGVLAREFDLVHYWWIDAAMALRRRPSVVTCHGKEILESNVPPYRRPLFRAALNEASMINANSRFTKQYLVSAYGIDPRRVVVINPGVSISSFSQREPRPVNDGHYVIGTLSRFVWRKNILSIVKALSTLEHSYGLSFEYRLAGDGPDRNKILNALKDSGIVYTYYGRISDADKMNQFYPSLDVFVLPPMRSQNDVEGFGIVFLEANACGVPVVASDTGGIADAVCPDVSGVFADPKRPEDIARKIHGVLTSGTDWRESARRWAEQFSDEEVGRQFSLLYERVGNGL